MSPRTSFLFLVLATCSALAAAQSYPAKPVRIIVAYPAGGSVDIVARTVGQRLSETMGRTFVVENRSGASGNISTDYVAKAAPDGYTLLMASAAAMAANPALYAKLPFDPVKDFAPITLIVVQPNIFVVHPTVPAKSVQEFVALAKARPQTLNYGSSGVGGSQHMAAELFVSMTGVKINHVPYKGGAPALTDLVGGQIDLMFETIPTAIPYVKSGRLRALAVTTAQRSEVFPDLPTMQQAGLPNYEYRGWIGLTSPAGTPPEIVAKLNAEVVRAVHQGGLGERYKEMAFQVVAGTPEQFAQFVKDEIALNQKIVKVAGVKLEQ